LTNIVGCTSATQNAL